MTPGRVSSTRRLFFIFAGSCFAHFCFTLPTIARKIAWTDNGELSAVAYLLGIAHPTGYPLLTIASRIVASVVPSTEVVYSLNLFSSACVSASVGFVALIIFEIVSTHMRKRRSERTWYHDTACSVGGACVYGSVSTVWMQAVSFEVYALQSLLFALFVYSVLRAHRDGEEHAGQFSRWWAMAGLMLGFGLSNHMSMVYVVPAILVFMLSGKPWRSVLWRWLVIGVFAAIALSVYLYLPIRSWSDPPLHWGEPGDLSSFLSHVSGKQYQVWMFSGSDVFLAKSQEFLARLPAEMGWTSISLAIAGLWLLIRSLRRHALFFGLLMLAATLYSFNYDIADLEAYFLLFYVASGVLAGLGLFYVISEFSGTRGIHFLSIGIVAYGLSMLFLRFGEMRQIDGESPEPFAREVLNSVDSMATILTAKWDFLYSPALALQNIQGVRKDVTLIDMHLLRDRTWYLRQTRNRVILRHPGMRPAFDAFLTELLKFEKGEPFEFAVIQDRWLRLLDLLIRRLIERGPVLVDHQAAAVLPPGFGFEPDGFLLSVTVDTTARYREQRFPRTIPFTQRNDKFGKDFRRFLSVAYVNHALRAVSQGQAHLADSAMVLASRIDPSNPAIQQFQSRFSDKIR